MRQDQPLTAYIEGIGILGPGIGGWPAARAILAGERGYTSQKTQIPAPEQLPASAPAFPGLTFALTFRFAPARSQSWHDLFPLTFVLS